MRAVSDAGPLIHLSWISRLDLLAALFDEVLVPAAVRDEVLRADPALPGVLELRGAFAAAGWLQIRDAGRSADLTRALAQLDPGESEAIALAKETAVDTLLIDERRARSYAQREGLQVLGTIGILQRARDRGMLPSAATLLDQLRAQGFRVSSDLVELVRREESP